MWNTIIFSKPLEIVLAQGPWIAASLFWVYVFGYFVIHRSFPSSSVLWRLVFIFAGLLLIYGLTLSGLQYYMWSKAAPSKYLLPPYAPLSYFLNYAFYHFLYRISIAMFASFLTGGILWFMNQDYDRRFMEPYEIPLFILGGLIAGWPNFFVYLLGGLFFGVIFGLILRFRYGAERVSLALPFFLAAGMALSVGSIIGPLLLLDRIQI